MKITQYSRISHHTITGTVSAGLTFSVPVSEDFTDGTWTVYDLALSEIGINENDEKAYIRIGSNIKELYVYGNTSSAFQITKLADTNLSTTASIYDIITYSVPESGNYLLNAQLNFNLIGTSSTSLSAYLDNSFGSTTIAYCDDYIIYDSIITSCNKSMTLNNISYINAGDIISLKAKAWDTNQISVTSGTDGRTHLNIIKL